VFFVEGGVRTTYTLAMGPRQYVSRKVWHCW